MCCAHCGCIFCPESEEDGVWLSGQRILYCSLSCKKRAKVKRQKLSRACTSKTRYKHEWQADVSVRVLAVKGYGFLRSYSCSHCGGFHLTSKAAPEQEKTAV